jgi:carbonic anhydrase/acetyltransferase-like protein (isoleucine patch superfamily)
MAIYRFDQHAPQIPHDAYVADSATVLGRVTLGAKASVWFGAVVRGDVGPIVIGPGSLVEDNVVMHGRVRLGRGCVIGHGAVLHDCVVGDRAVVGANAVVFGATVGELAVNAHSPAAEPSPLDLRAVTVRTMQCVLRDVYFIEQLGRWIGRFLAQHRWPEGRRRRTEGTEDTGQAKIRRREGTDAIDLGWSAASRY